jgi:hypothetical protein
MSVYTRTSNSLLYNNKKPMLGICLLIILGDFSLMSIALQSFHHHINKNHTTTLGTSIQSLGAPIRKHTEFRLCRDRWTARRRESMTESRSFSGVCEQASTVSSTQQHLIVGLNVFTKRPDPLEVRSTHTIIVNHLTHLLTHARRSEHAALLHGSEPVLNLSEKEGLA